MKNNINVYLKMAIKIHFKIPAILFIVFLNFTWKIIENKIINDDNTTR